MNKIKVTLGICVRNVENTIEETINTIINQNFPKKYMEIIFVDDGSEDKTLLIINKISSNIKIINRIFHHEWLGLGKTRNVVVNNALGKYILWIDGDMLLSPNYIKESVNYMDEHPEVGIAKGKYSLKPGGNWLSSLEIYARYAKNMVDFNNTMNSMGTGGAIYRIQSIREVNGFNDNIKGYGEDQDLENRIKSKCWKLAQIDVKFQDYERNKMKWNDLWVKYYKRGYDIKYIPKQKLQYFNIYGMIPPVAFIAGLIHSFQLFKITRNLLSFLLPFQYFFKMSAWCNGYMRAMSQIK